MKYSEIHEVAKKDSEAPYEEARKNLKLRRRLLYWEQVVAAGKGPSVDRIEGLLYMAERTLAIVQASDEDAAYDVKPLTSYQVLDFGLDVEALKLILDRYSPRMNLSALDT